MSLICSILSTQTTAVRQGSEMRRIDTMTTEPDIGLECSLFKQMIIAGNSSESVLEQRVLEWVETRLNFSDPGFHLLGPKLDAICDEIVLRRDEYNLVRTQYEHALKLQPGKIVEVEQVHASILKNQSGENLEEKKKNLMNGWLARWTPSKLKLRCWGTNILKVKGLLWTKSGNWCIKCGNLKVYMILICLVPNNKLMTW